METMETVEAPVCPADMNNLFERAFNPQLCKEIAERADERMTSLTIIYVNGIMHNIKGASICYSQVLKLNRRDWCGPSYKVMYREDVNRDEPMRELKVGVTIRVSPNMAFSVIRDNSEDQFLVDEAERRLMRRL